jgi:hypothetical protein
MKKIIDGIMFYFALTGLLTLAAFLFPFGLIALGAISVYVIVAECIERIMRKNRGGNV